MRQKLLSSRAVVTRTSRGDPRGAVLESVAAEFALLAQRRARISRQLELLGRQVQAAEISLGSVLTRMRLLAARIDTIDPALRPQFEVEPEPPPPPPPPPKPSLVARAAKAQNLGATPRPRPRPLAAVRRPYPAR